MARVWQDATLRQIQTWEGSAHSILGVFGLPIAGHDVALLCANHELGWPRLRIVLQAAEHKYSNN